MCAPRLPTVSISQAVLSTSTETVSATQAGLSPPSRSTVTRTTAWAPLAPRSSGSSSAPARTRDPTGTGKPEDIAATVSFFAREEASFVSGQVVYVAGGPRA